MALGAPTVPSAFFGSSGVSMAFLDPAKHSRNPSVHSGDPVTPLGASVGILGALTSPLEDSAT